MNDIKERYRILTERAFELICELDNNGLFQYVSPRYKEILGYSSDDLAGEPFLHTVHPDDQRRVYRTFLKSLRNPDEIFTVEYRGIAKWDQWRWFECTGLPLELENGKHGGLLISRDLKERKQTEAIRLIFTQFYKEKEKIVSFDFLSQMMDKQLSSIIEDSDIYIALYDSAKKKKRILFCNDKHQNFTSGDDVSFKGEFTDYIWKSGKELFLRSEEFKAAGKEFGVSKLPKSLQFLGVPIFSKGKTIGVLVLQGYKGGEIYDESDLKFIQAYAYHISLIAENLRTDIDRRQTENMLQMVLDNIPQFVFWKDRNSVYIGSNKNFFEAAGLNSIEEIIGTTDFDMPWSKEEAVGYRADDKAVMESGEPKYHIHEPQTRQDGSVAWLDTSKIPLRDENGEVFGVLGTFEDITQRKMNEEAIKNSELKYHTLFESSNDAIFIMTEDMFVDCNNKTLEMYECSREEIIGKHPIDFSPEFQDDGLTSLDKAKEKIQGVLAGENQIFEWTHSKLDGTPFDAEVSLGLMEINQVKYILAVVRDISERKKNLHELGVQKAYLEELFIGSPEATVILDNDDNVQRINREFTKLFGFEENEVVGKKLAELIIPVEYLDEGEELNERVNEGQIVLEDTIRHSKDGRKIDVSIIGNRVILDGKQIALLGVYRDISERIEAVRALQKSEENLATILDGIREAVIATDTNSIITRVNPGTELLLGATSSDLIGKHICKIIQLNDSALGDKLLCPVKEALELNKAIEINDCTLSCETIENSVRISAISSPIRGDDGMITGCVLVLKDISEELRLREQLYESQKMEAVGQLAGGIAHDFNNLLAIIKGHSNIALMSMDEENPAKEKFDLILRTVERSSRLIKQLLTFGRKEQIDPQLIDLNVIVNELDKMLNRLIVENVELVFDLEEELGLVYADPGHLEQIVVNLTINARDAMPNGGILKISTENTVIEEDNPLIISHNIEAGKYISLKFEDQGKGIDPENLEKIFEPFFTTKATGQGTGLGLSTVYGIVQQNKGAIEVISEVDVGTIFTIYLPDMSS